MHKKTIELKRFDEYGRPVTTITASVRRTSDGKSPKAQTPQTLQKDAHDLFRHG